ncbi:MAG: SRPBCC family protein [Gammaproteobacteria bacterium]|nr:SRPBCC family protein [Gammaproteobacteria bacterium]
MKTVKLETELDAPVEQVWSIFADVTRSDWVPGVDAITEEDGIRSFNMAGIGEVQEKILKLDHQNHCLQYSAIKTPSGVDHHLAIVQLAPLANDRCRLQWTTEIEPEQFAIAIEQAMKLSLDGLRGVLASDG